MTLLTVITTRICSFRIPNCRIPNCRLQFTPATFTAWGGQGVCIWFRVFPAINLRLVRGRVPFRRVYPSEWAVPITKGGMFSSTTTTSVDRLEVGPLKRLWASQTLYQEFQTFDQLMTRAESTETHGAVHSCGFSQIIQVHVDSMQFCMQESVVYACLQKGSP